MNWDCLKPSVLSLEERQREPWRPGAESLWQYPNDNSNEGDQRCGVVEWLKLATLASHWDTDFSPGC